MSRAIRQHARDDDRVRPLSRTRIETFLVASGYHYLLDADGDPTGLWDGHRFWFLTLGEHEEILQVRGRWRRTAETDKRRALLLAANDWNRDRIWPKVYLREEDDVIAVYTEVSVDLERGVTDAQLYRMLECGLGTGARALAAFDAAVPDDPRPSA